MKKFLAVVLALSMLFTFCTSLAFADDAKTIKIGVEMSTSTNTIFIDMVQRIRDTAAKYADEGINVEIIEQYSTSDASKMITDMENFVAAGCAGVIFQNFDPEACEDAIKAAESAGVVLCSFDANDDNCTMSFYGDNYQAGYIVGTMAADWIKENLDGKAQVGLVNLSSMVILDDRIRGIRAALGDLCPGAECVIEGDAFAVDTLSLVENFLQAYPNLDVVCCYGDTAGVNAELAMENGAAAGNWDISKHAVFSYDGTVEGITAVACEDKMNRGTVSADLINRAEMMLNMLMDEILGRTPAGTEMKVPNSYVPVTEANVFEDFADYVDMELYNASKLN